MRVLTRVLLFDELPAMIAVQHESRHRSLEYCFTVLIGGFFSLSLCLLLFSLRGLLGGNLRGASILRRDLLFLLD